MLHITFRLAAAQRACRSDYAEIADLLGGDEMFGLDTPIPLSVVIEYTSLDSALWALRCVLPEEELKRDNFSRLFSCDCADLVLPIVKPDCEGGQILRRTIDIVRRFATGKVSTSELAHARQTVDWRADRDIAWAIVWSLAADVSWRAAEAVAWRAAEAIAWTTVRLAPDDDAGNIPWVTILNARYDVLQNTARNTARNIQKKLFLDRLKD